MKKLLPNDTINMDIALVDIYKIYLLLGYCNTTQFDGDYGETLWERIDKKYDDKGDLDAKSGILPQGDVQDSIYFLNHSTKEKHLELFNQIFNNSYSVELEKVEAEILDLNKSLELAYAVKRGLLNQP